MKKTVAVANDRPTNHVTLFSNGIGHFRRTYEVTSGKNGKSISIPFKTEHVSDVLASLSVYGPVKYVSTPSFSPADSRTSSIDIDSADSLRGLLQGLSGSEVKVTLLPGFVRSGGDDPINDKPLTLVGLSPRTSRSQNGETIREDSLVLSNDGGLLNVDLSKVQNVEFLDDSVRAEISKALKSNFQTIKPDSTFVDMTVASLDGKAATAVVQYTNPVAAWKMRYNIRSENGKFFLEGSAIIDNNTDEDWNDFQVSVVTGNPISFSTDLADIVVPTRQKINLVDTETLSNVTVEDAMRSAVLCAAPSPGTKNMKTAHAKAARMSENYANSASFGLAAVDMGGLESCGNARGGIAMGGPAAVAPGVESKEVGDFCIFTNNDLISIASKRSAIVPMFEVELPLAGSVLLYKEENHQRRPFRAVKLKNETEYSLGRGKVSIYQDGVFQGEAVMEPAKPGDQRMLPHCLENGVRVVKEFDGSPTNWQSSININEGMAITESVTTNTTSYTIQNKKNEEFKFLLEHRNVLPNSKHDINGVKVEETEKLSNGIRVYFVLKANETLTVKVLERSVNTQSISIGHNYGWLHTSVIHPNAQLAKDPGIKVCMAIQDKIAKVQQEIRELHTLKNNYVAQAQRHRENLGAIGTGDKSETSASWIVALDKITKNLQEIEETKLPALQAQERALWEEMTKAMAKISIKWNAEPAMTVK